ncbi:MAG: efflux RND transporter permease subunit [Gammaproteobacteria bacterium]|nr:efflux RND transporter permease subunit [Gammaproteobacteria bacterium]
MIEYFARNHIAVYLITFLLLVLGFIAISNSTIERYPELDLRTIAVNVPYDGATPREVEEDIIRRIEESIAGLDGIDRITANAWEGRGEILIELNQWVDAVSRLEIVRTAVERIEDFPPPNADPPEVVRKEIVRDVASLVVTSPTAGEDRLRRAAEDLREQLLLLPNVGLVELVGARDREIQIDLDESQLRSHHLTIAEVAARVRLASVNVTGGGIRTESGTIVMSTMDKRVRGDEFRDIVMLSRPDGAIIRLGDMGTVRDGFVDDPLINTVNQVPAVFVHVQAPPRANPDDVIAEVERFMAGYQAPPGTSVELWLDETYKIKKPLQSVANNGVISAMLVFVVLILLFDLRIGLWIGIGIPTAIIGSFIILYLLDVSISFFIVYGVAMIIGIVVDDAIVVGENIARLRARGVPPLEASIQGAREVLPPVLVGVLTTMVAFSVLLPLDGILGQMFSYTGIGVLAVLLLSLIDCFLLLPAHLSGGSPLSRWPLSAVQARASGSFQALLDRRLMPSIGFAARRPLLTIAGVALFVIVAIGLFSGNVLRYNTADNRLDEQKLQADLTMAAGSTFEDTVHATEQIVRAARAANRESGGTGINAVNLIVGQHKAVETMLGADVPDPAPNLASVQLRLNVPPERTIITDELKQLWIDNIGTIRGADKLAFPSTRTATASSVGYALLHPDADTVVAAASELKARLEDHPYVYQIDDTLELGNVRYEVQLTDAGRASGLTAISLAGQLRNRFYGSEVDQIVRHSEELEVMARYPLERRANISDLHDELISLPNSDVAALSSVAQIVQTQDLKQRQRIDGLPAASVNAFYNVAMISSRELGGLIEGSWLPELKHKYPDLRILPDGSSRDAAKVGRSLATYFPAAVLLIFVLAAIQLRSILQPFYVLLGVPLAFAGSIYLHWMLGYDLSLSSIFGLIAVTGVVINDSLVLLDRYNRMRRDDPRLGVSDAIIQAAQLRARPIVLTTVTTVVGLSPLLYDKSEVLRFLIPLVVSLTGGLIFASIGILFLLPAIMVLVERLRALLAERFGQPAATAAP